MPVIQQPAAWLTCVAIPQQRGFLQPFCSAEGLLVVRPSSMQAAGHAAAVWAAAAAAVAAMQAAVKAARRARLAAWQTSSPQVPLQEIKGAATLQALGHRDLAIHLLWQRKHLFIDV